MKRFFIITILCLSCAMGFAQWEDAMDFYDADTLNIEIDNDYFMPLHKAKRKYNWYAEQACAWQRVVEADPKNENAWRNFFFASYHYEANNWHDFDFINHKDSSQTAVVMRKMKAAIPNTYIFNLCASLFWLKEWGEIDKNVVINALDYGMYSIHVEVLRSLTYKLWEIDHDNELLSRAFRELYERRYFPERIMAYGWNLMLGMKDSAVYVANTSRDYEQMILMQEVFNARKDITIIPCSAIKSKAFRDYISKRLNIKPFVTDPNEVLTDEQRNTLFIRDLYGQRNQPVYLPMNIGYYSYLDRDSIYNEGLLLKYSTKRYDNISVARHNFKDVYELEYLTQPDYVYDNWQESDYVDRNIIFCVTKMADKFAQFGYKDDAKRLENFIGKVFRRDEMRAVSRLQYHQRWW